MNICELVPEMSASEISQSGNAFTLDGQSGTVDGIKYLINYDYTPRDGFTGTVTFNFSMINEDEFSGRMKVYVTNGTQSAQREMLLEARRVVVEPKYNSAGKWRLNATMEGANFCGKLTKRTFDVTIEQSGFVFKITGDFDADYSNEIVPGAIFDTIYEGVSDPVDDNNVKKAFTCDFEMKSKDSLSGTIVIYDCKSSGCKTIYNIIGTKISG
jgi:hypothetical protein